MHLEIAPQRIDRELNGMADQIAQREGGLELIEATDGYRWAAREAGYIFEMDRDRTILQRLQERGLSFVADKEELGVDKVSPLPVAFSHFRHLPHYRLIGETGYLTRTSEVRVHPDLFIVGLCANDDLSMAAMRVVRSTLAGEPCRLRSGDESLTPCDPVSGSFLVCRPSTNWMETIEFAGDRSTSFKEVLTELRARAEALGGQFGLGSLD